MWRVCARSTWPCKVARAISRVQHIATTNKWRQVLTARAVNSTKPPERKAVTVVVLHRHQSILLACTPARAGTLCDHFIRISTPNRFIKGIVHITNFAGICPEYQSQHSMAVQAPFGSQWGTPRFHHSGTACTHRRANHCSTFPLWGTWDHHTQSV